MRVCEIDRVQEDGRCRETVRDRVREREGERVRAAVGGEKVANGVTRFKSETKLN